MQAVNWIALILVIIGALNWGLVGLFSLDLVATLLGTMTLVTRIVYVVVGVAGVYIAIISPKLMK